MVPSVYCLDSLIFFFSFFFNATPTPEIYTLSLHDALPISAGPVALSGRGLSGACPDRVLPRAGRGADRKSTRLNSSHRCISYAVFCLKKKKKNKHNTSK